MRAVALLASYVAGVSVACKAVDAMLPALQAPLGASPTGICPFLIVGQIEYLADSNRASSLLQLA